MSNIRIPCLPGFIWKRGSKFVADCGFRIGACFRKRPLRDAVIMMTAFALSVMIALPAAALGVNWSGSLETGPDYGDGTGDVTYDNDFRLKLDVSNGGAATGVLLLRYWLPIPSDRLEESEPLTIHQAYLDLKLGAAALLRAGRQKISWGSGLAWNPTNYIGAAKNRADLGNESPGVDALDFEKGFGESLFTMLVKPQGAAGDWGKAIKYATRFGNHDLAFSLYQQGAANGFGLDWAASIADFTVYAELAAIAGAKAGAKAGTVRSYIGESGGALVPLTRPGNERYLYGVAGFSRFLPGDWMIQMEYYYNQAGWNGVEAENYYNYQGPEDLPTATYFGDLRRNYFYALFRKGELITDLAATFSILGNLDDGGMMVTPGLEYRWGANTTGSFTVTWFAGDDHSEFGTMPDRLQIDAKVTVSF